MSAVAVNADDVRQSDQNYDNARPFSEIPGPRGLPYIGTLLEYRRGPFSPETYHKALMQRYFKYGNIFKETISGETIVHLFDPDYIQTVYQHEGKIPHIPPLLETTQMYRKFRDMSPGLGNINGDEWYRLRSAVQQMMMRPKAVSVFLRSVNQVASDFLDRLQQIRDPMTGEVPNFTNEIMKWTFESSAMTCFEERQGSFDDDTDSFTQSMIDANNKIFVLSMKLRFGIPWFRWLPSPTWKKLVHNEDYFFRNGQKLVDRTVTSIQKLADKNQLQEGQYSFLTYLLGRKELSFRDVSIITLSLFNDGLKTTSPTTVGQVYCLAINPDKQEKLYEEIKKVAPNKDEPVTDEMLRRLPYLKACIKEGFRFFPIGVEVSRIPQKNMVIGGYQIPARTQLQLNNNMLLRLDEYFAEPESYIPERWTRGELMEKVHPYLLLPFGYGPRTCAGRRFAEQEMYVFLVKLLQNFRVTWPNKQPMKQKYEMLLRPDIPATFRFEPRN